MLSRVLACLALLVLSNAGCGSGGGGDAAAGDGGGACPSQRPMDGTSCTGSPSCSYGHSTCCGMEYSAYTCKCEFGSFSCAQTVECNIICDAGPSDAESGGGG
jgi:hypothetical protein